MQHSRLMFLTLLVWLIKKSRSSGIRGKSRSRIHLTYGNPARAHFPFIIHEHRWPRAIKTLCSDYDYVVDDVKLVSVSHGFLGRSVVASSAMAEAAFSRSPSSATPLAIPCQKLRGCQLRPTVKREKSHRKSRMILGFIVTLVSSAYSCGSTMSRTFESIRAYNSYLVSSSLWT